MQSWEFEVSYTDTLTILVVGFPIPWPAFDSIRIISGLVCASTCVMKTVTHTHNVRMLPVSSLPSWCAGVGP